MHKIHLKLISVAVALLMSVSVVVASSYAWMVLSANPVATGIQVAIGGGNTILIAPNIQETVDGVVYNYPGYFSDKMNFSQESAYDYLDSLGNLNPVSTVNGIDWILPVYYSGNEAQVQQGTIASGTLKDISEFLVDSELQYANLDAKAQDDIHKGHYIYLDFWVVSPGTSYRLRVSTGVDELDGGSFVIDLQEAEADGDSYKLTEQEGSAASAVRVGFLANDLRLTDDTMLNYQNSRYFDEQYTSLRGMYLEPDSGTVYLDANRFTIYEPNGDYHPEYPELDGKYLKTKPLGLVDGEIQEQDTRKNLTVQKKSTWAPAATGEGTAIEQRFQVAIYGQSWSEDMTTEEITDYFYETCLQGQISTYIRKAAFIQNTDNLYARLVMPDSYISEEILAGETKGATDDVYIIELERNVPQRVRMFIWLEGQDMDCVDSVSTSRFAVNIELACGDE